MGWWSRVTGGIRRRGTYRRKVRYQPNLADNEVSQALNYQTMLEFLSCERKVREE